MQIDLDAIREAMKAKSDDELRLVVTLKRVDYQEVALQVAREELYRRGIDGIGNDAVEEAQKRVEEKRLKEMSSRWINIYIWLIGVQATFILARVAFFYFQASVLAQEIVVGGTMAGLAITTVVGLYMRHLWAWYLNWVFLVGWVLVCMWGFSVGVGGGVAAAIAGGLGGAIWSIPNAIYFKKRRHMFG